MVAQVVAAISLFWGSLVVFVASIGYWQIRLNYSSIQPRSRAEEEGDCPHVTVIRPAKGLDPQLYQCLASTFRQSYPRDKLTIYLCVASRTDAAVPVLEQLLRDFPNHDAKLFVEEEDMVLQEFEQGASFGPNPKIRSMSRAYREVKGDLVWVVDCNVWVAKGVCGRMVDRLLGRGKNQKAQKMAHQLPLVVDTESQTVASSSTRATEASARSDSVSETKGGRIEEMFMSSSHAKFYTAINTVKIAPCLVGKSNMFRRLHLNALTNNEGIDYFSHNICEDHMIGDLLWKSPVPQSVIDANANKHWGNHGMLWGDLVIQPVANMRVREYAARRQRWLRVRKWTVPSATAAEPTTESFVCGFSLAYGLTSLNYAHELLGIPRTWSAFGAVWLSVICSWAIADWTLYRKIHSMVSVAQDENTPSFCRPAPYNGARRPLYQWLPAWLGREGLAFPIWFWAVFCGATVTWRGRHFLVNMDMRVSEIKGNDETTVNGDLNRHKQA